MGSVEQPEREVCDRSQHLNVTNIRTMTREQVLTKIEVARRQLVTAIRLFFDNADSVSVYTLGHAAAEILDRLCRHRGKMSFRGEIKSVHGFTDKELKRIAELGKDFFKHADRDPDGELSDFADTLNDAVLAMATTDYHELEPTRPIELQLYLRWYFVTNGEKVGAELYGLGLVAFDEMTGLSRAEQKAIGRETLARARIDPDVLSDSTTDNRPVGPLRRA
jgi:hypothetical protein